MTVHIRKVLLILFLYDINCTHLEMSDQDESTCVFKYSVRAMIRKQSKKQPPLSHGIYNRTIAISIQALRLMMLNEFGKYNTRRVTKLPLVRKHALRPTPPRHSGREVRPETGAVRLSDRGATFVTEPCISDLEPQ